MHVQSVAVLKEFVIRARLALLVENLRFAPAFPLSHWHGMVCPRTLLERLTPRRPIRTVPTQAP